MTRWAIVLSFCLMALSAGCGHMRGFEDWQTMRNTETGATGVELQSSPQYRAYRAEVDSWGTFDYLGITLKDLGADFVDILSVELSIGPGLILDIQPTKLLEFGFGFANFMRIGFRGRAAGYYAESRKEGGFSALYYRSLDFDPIYGTLALFQRPRVMRDFTLRHNEDRNWSDIGLTVHLVYGGLGLYISPMNVIDFGLDVVALPYNLVLRPIGRGMGFNPPEIDLGNDDTLAQTRDKYNLQIVRPLHGFPPAEQVDESFRVGY